MRYLLFFLFVTASFYAQNVHFKNVTTKEGLSNNSVNTILNNKDGSLWIGTWDGLNLYDGKKITVYKHATQNHSSIAGNTIYKLIKDNRGQLWIWSDDKKVSKFLGDGKFENYSFKKSIQDIYSTEDGSVFVLFRDKRIHQFDGKAFVKVKTVHREVTAKETLLNQLQTLWPTTALNDVLQEDATHFWLATKDKGLYLVVRDNGVFQIKNRFYADPFQPLSFLSNEIVVLHRDILGNIWLGTKDGGLSKMVNRKEDIETIYLNQYTQPNLPSETVRAITEDKQGNLWLGYYTQGVFRQREKGGVLFPYALARARENPDWLRIRSLYTDTSGALWIGTYAGVVQIKDGKENYFDKTNTPYFTNNRNYHFFESNHILWMACWGGIAKYDLSQQKFVSFLNQEELSQYHIRHISSDGNQLLLATEKEGVLFYNIKSGEINHLNQEQGVLGNSVFATYVDSYTKDIWIASLGGISVFSPNKILKHQLTEEKGLPSHLVYGFLPHKNSLWISTTKGISSIDKKSLKLLNFSNYSGWQGLEFSEGAAYQNATGKLMFAGNKGVNVFEPEKLKVLHTVPYFKMVFNGQPMEATQTVKRAYTENDIKLELYPIGFDTYLKNQFEYRIKGLFEDWRNLSEQEILLDKLSPKAYTIEVRDTLKPQNNIVFSKTFVIEKPYYAHPLFIIFGCSFILTLVIWSIRRKQRVLKLRELELKEQVASRTQEVLKQKENLTAQNVELNVLNQEILKQKREVLELHSRFKNGDIEIEKFRVFVLSKIKKRLVGIIENLDEKEISSKSKHQLVQLYDMVREWDYLEQIKDFEPQRLISVELHNFVDRLNEDCKYIEKKYDVKINAQTTIGEHWIETDLLRFKFLFKYFINECCKYMTREEQIDISFEVVENNLEVTLCSESNLLHTYWKENSLYSPYYRAFYVLLQDLEGTLTERSQEQFKVVISIPLRFTVEAEITQDPKDWNVFLEQIKILPKDKYNLLVYSSNQEYLLVQQLLGDEQTYHLVYNDRINEVISNIEHYKFDALILYNTPVSDTLRSLFNQIQKKVNKQRLLIFYIAEEADYFLQEQLAQLGVTDFVHLPLNKKLIDNKIQKRIRYDKQNKESKAFEWDNISSEEGSRLESPNERLLRKAMELMKAQLASADFGIEQLSKELGVSKMKCYRIFKEVLNVAPLEVLIQLRLKKAESLLQQGNLTISEISFECGFNDPKHFSKTFKKHYHSSPSSYKKIELGIVAGLSEY